MMDELLSHIKTKPITPIYLKASDIDNLRNVKVYGVTIGVGERKFVLFMSTNENPEMIGYSDTSSLLLQNLVDAFKEILANDDIVQLIIHEK